MPVVQFYSDFIPKPSLILCLVSPGIKPLYNTYVIVVVLIAFFIGFVVNLFLHVQCQQVWNKFFNSRGKYDELMQQIKQYMNYKVLPMKIKEKIWLYIKFKYQNRFYNEHIIQSMLSDAIQEEVMTNIASQYLPKAEILRQMPDYILCKVVSKLVSEIYLPDEVIVKAGKAAQSMYFVYYGTLAVYNEDDEEIKHLEDGDCFGEMDMLYNKKRTHTIVAVTPCELFKLETITLEKILEDHPTYRTEFFVNSRERLFRSSTVRVSFSKEVLKS